MDGKTSFETIAAHQLRLYLIRMMESNRKEAKVFITGLSVEPKQKETLPF